MTAGFFFPKLRGLRGQDVHADLRTEPVTDQALVGPHLEGAEAALLLRPLKPLLHVPSSEGDSQHVLDRRVPRSVADEVFDLTRVVAVHGGRESSEGGLGW